MGAFSRDLRLSFRALRQRPAVTLVAILALGLAIGASTAMFSVLVPARRATRIDPLVALRYE